MRFEVLASDLPPFCAGDQKNRTLSAHSWVHRLKVFNFMMQQTLRSRSAYFTAIICFVALVSLIVPGCSGLLQNEGSAQATGKGQPGEISDENPDESVELPEIAHARKVEIREWVGIEDFRTDLAVFETVFWEPLDTPSLRQLLRTTPMVDGKSVMEIGTGSGLISLCCLKANAKSVIATDVNVSAIANAEYNAKRFGYDDRFEVRKVSLDNAGAFTVIKDSEKFDFIISNPPWEDDVPKSIDEYALYDPGFKLLDSLLVDCRAHLNPGGKIYLAYGCVTAIKVIFKLADKYDLEYRVLDNRNLDDLTEVFLPGMMIELTPKEFLADAPQQPGETPKQPGEAPTTRSDEPAAKPLSTDQSSSESESAAEVGTDQDSDTAEATDRN